MINLLLVFTVLTCVHVCAAQMEDGSLVIGQSHVLHSEILKEDRVINVVLPEGYKPGDTTRYPVIYILDGGMDEDFLHIAGLVQFNTQPWIARFPKSIVVGISGNSRRRDFTFPVDNTGFIEKEGFRKSDFPEYGGSGKYIDFIANELQPYMGSTYGAAARNMVIGESLAGLLVTEMLIRHPELFDDYIIISPSLWWGGQTLLKDTGGPLKHFSGRVNVYLGVPCKDEDLKMYAESEALRGYLGENENINLVFDYMPDELHATVMHQAVYNAFRKLYSKENTPGK